MKRLMFALHRYLGLALCLVVAAWCLSGVVMMYVRFPSFYGTERLAMQPPLSLGDCCNIAAARAVAADLPIDAFRIEMLAERPVLRLDGAPGSTLSVDLASGSIIEPLDRSQASGVAAAYARAAAMGATPRLLAVIDHDQWTVSGSPADRPLYHFALDDAAGTEIYVSSSSGEIVQRSTARQRFWNYFGAVTHWIYPTLLREQVRTWSQVVIWAAVAGLLLALTGLYAGWTRWHPRRAPRASPYRGVALWHHYSGLLFGVLVLGWVGSGLVSMNPWGLLPPGSSRAERQQLAGLQVDSNQALDAVERLVERGVAADVRQVQSAPFAGHLFLLERTPVEVVRVDATTLEPSVLTVQALRDRASHLRPEQSVREAGLTARGDSYYYPHHAQPPFPVYRVVLNDPEATRYYIDPQDGSLLRKIDRNGQRWRWLFSAAHQWDFSALMRSRPLWDVVLITLLAGMSSLALTGVWLAARYLGRPAADSRADSR